MSTSPPKRIVILGGGFAGLYAAMELEKTLARDPELEITLVNRENFFLFTPMLHEVAASDLDITAIVNPLQRDFEDTEGIHLPDTQMDRQCGGRNKPSAVSRMGNRSFAIEKRH